MSRLSNLGHSGLPLKYWRERTKIKIKIDRAVSVSMVYNPGVQTDSLRHDCVPALLAKKGMSCGERVASANGLHSKEQQPTLFPPRATLNCN